MYDGVPTILYIQLKFFVLANPKSVIFIFPPTISILDGFISLNIFSNYRWIIPFLTNYARPVIICII